MKILKVFFSLYSDLGNFRIFLSCDSKVMNFPVFDAYNVNFQELQLDFIFRIMPQKQIFGHGAIVFLSHLYQMANPKSILEMWLAGLDMAKILAIRRKWTLNGMNHSRSKTGRSWFSWWPPWSNPSNRWPQIEILFTGYQFGQRTVHFRTRPLWTWQQIKSLSN